MVTVYDVPPNELISAVADKLKQDPALRQPAWAAVVKTGVHKERPPTNPDWWHIRAAAVLRSVYKLGPIGTSKLRTRYGGSKRRGHKPAKFAKGSGNIIRKVLQQLEKAGYVKKVEKGLHKGRIITPQGKSLLDKTAVELKKKLAAQEKAPLQVRKISRKKPAVQSPAAQSPAAQKQQPRQPKPVQAAQQTA